MAVCCDWPAIFFVIYFFNVTRLQGEETHTHPHTCTYMHRHLKLTDQRPTSKNNKWRFSQDLTSDEKHMWSQVPSLFSISEC